MKTDDELYAREGERIALDVEIHLLTRNPNTPRAKSIANAIHGVMLVAANSFLEQYGYPIMDDTKHVAAGITNVQTGANVDLPVDNPVEDTGWEVH
jgi:hypothetical protein